MNRSVDVLVAEDPRTGASSAAIMTPQPMSHLDYPVIVSRRDESRTDRVNAVDR